MKKILVAMSGGVDSSVTAALLLEQGYEVAGATMRTWASNTCVNRNTRSCCGLTGVEDARDVAERLEIRHWVFNFEEEFKRHVVDYFAEEYRRGRTPNPCIACNEHIKFRLFLKRARQLGFDGIATGHYAKVCHSEALAPAEAPGVCGGTGKTPETGLKMASHRYWIEEGIDPAKDQSYVLFPLDQEVLSRTLLPLGSCRKSEIREKARTLGLVSVMEKPDSQEICFIPSKDYPAFLEKEFEMKPRPGVIRTKDGKVLGNHQGYHQFTRGQRRGLGVNRGEPAGRPYYVLQTIPETNEVIVGEKEDVLDRTFRVERMHGMVPLENISKKGDSPQKRGLSPFLFQAHVKIRSQHPKAPAVIEVLSPAEAQVTFTAPQEAVTPGQAAVFYDGPRVLGGGWIASQH